MGEASNRVLHHKPPRGHPLWGGAQVVTRLAWSLATCTYETNPLDGDTSSQSPMIDLITSSSTSSTCSIWFTSQTITYCWSHETLLRKWIT